MKTFADDTDRSDEYPQQLRDDLLDAAQAGFRSARAGKTARNGGEGTNGRKYMRFFPYAPLFVMACAILLLDAILPLRDLWFHEAQLTQLGTWPVLPSQLLFPGWTVIPPIPQVHVNGVPDIPPSWGTLGLLFGAFAAVFLTYIFALRRLPTRATKRFVISSTLILGLLFMLVPVVTSPDLYSYIAYARIGVIYGMNPLTTIPHAIHQDVIYNYVLWVDQPSAYGPTWTLLTCLFQWILSFCRLGNYILAMVLTLRAWGLAMHLASVALIWSISGSLQSLHGIVSQQKRLRATLAFAWNPLLLLEAATNAHNDTTLLFIMLLIVWLLVRAQLASEKPAARWIAWLNPTLRARAVYLLPAILLALGTCLKINLVLLAPGLFFYQWLQEAQQPVRQRLKRVGASVAAYAGLILGLYAPFWQGGAILDVFEVNPGTYRTINTLSDTLGHLYNGVVAAFGFPVGAQIGSPAEHFLHTLTMGIFVLIYAGICWQTLREPGTLRSIHGLVRWLAVTWLLYCAIGSPWFWPWYMITFFGLYALFEASKPAQLVLEEEYARPTSRQASISRFFKQFQNLLLQPTVVRGLTFSMLTLYCFSTWGPLHSFIPGLPGFQWSYLSGIWAWLLPLAGLKLVNRGPVSLLQKKAQRGNNSGATEAVSEARL